MDIRGVVFDVDDTLYDMSQPFFHAYRALPAARHDLPEQELFLSFRRFSDERFADAQTGKMTLQDLYIYRFRMMLRTFGIETTDAAALEFQHLYMRLQYQVQLSSMMKNLLGELCKHVAVGIITNGDSVHQRNKLRSLNVSPWISENHIIVSGDHVFSKPDVRIVQEMEQRLHLMPKHLLYVGDAFPLDIAGAAAAGWNSIWFNHRRRDRPDDAAFDADVEVHSEDELFRTIMTMIEK